MVSSGKTTETKKTAIINRTKQDGSVCDELKEIIGVGMVANSSGSEESEVDFTVIIGEDY